ncbi:DNA-binding transcriptional LysR family regulator [Catenuloplanes nepalensis]|uniref:DNA-binding transcriptional LysR family regulator n=1 Tax=Catenuloplanes nepalensis TaxID=587533 RepID=A0ABT9MSW2_9ACTN|nr:LysR substrate-binding domain-containing protein [Catenuloplanes nepalensis]MDP9794479.1 DNA-binding transcriptional LysR family regulator [Catenuloplanes nepalensis]
MVTLHQLRCFLATVEHGSFTAAAAALGYAQPSLSEQVRLLEQGIDARLFRRAGRGLTPTEAAHALIPHATAALAAVDAGTRAVAGVREVLTGTVRFGVFGTARLYLGAGLVEAVLARHPGIRLELAGLNSAQIAAQLRRGTLEAAVIALSGSSTQGLAVTPVMRDELVYVSADPERLTQAVTPARLATAPLVLPDVSFRDDDSTRRLIARDLQAHGHQLTTRVEVEDPETALEIAARGIADTVTWRGVLRAHRLPDGLGWTSLRPRRYETFAIAHRPDAVLSPAVRAVAELVTARMRDLDAQVRS